MKMTLAEKILARHCGRDKVKPGDMIMASVDMVLGTDVTVALSVDVFRSMGAKKVFDPNKIALVNDHFVPAKDVKAATLSKIMREFAHEQEITNYFEVGRSGICHSLLPDQGLVMPGDLVVGADSHTCTYGALGAFSTGIGSTDMACAWAIGELWFRVPESTKVVVEGKFQPYVGAKDLILHVINKLGVDGALYQAIEFTGSAIRNMSIDGRITVCNMAIEAGAKTGLITADEVVRDFVAKGEREKGRKGERNSTPPYPPLLRRGGDQGDELLRKVGDQGDELLHNAGDAGDKPLGRREDDGGIYLESDPDAKYCQTIHIDLNKLEPLVAEPYLPSNTRNAKELKSVKVDQVIIGSCTNGRIEDFRNAARIMGNRPVHPDVRMIMIPATPQIAKTMMDEGLAQKFIDAGAVIGPSTCGPCIGGHMGVLAQGEVGLFTTNRNFHGRNGHPDSKVYLSGPEVAAATAVTGRITDPRML